MFFPGNHLELRLLADRSHVDLCLRINALDAPMRIKNLLGDCLDPYVPNR